MNILPILLALLLTACGGGGDTHEPDDAPGAREGRVRVTTPAVKVMLWGDSTEAGARLPSGSSPSAEAQRILTKWGYNFDVRHEAVGGQPAFHLLTGRHPLYQGMAFPDYPSLASAHIGGIRSGLNEFRTAQTQLMFKATLQQLADDHRTAGKVMILTTPSPADPAVLRADWAAYIEASAETVREVYRANRDVAVLCDQNAYAKNLGIVTWKLDGLHPNDEANVLEGRLLARCILRAHALLTGTVEPRASGVGGTDA